MLKVKTPPSEGFDQETLLIPIPAIQCITQRGDGPVWITFWLEGKHVKRPIVNTIDELAVTLSTTPK